jgi:hypothetical protein
MQPNNWPPDNSVEQISHSKRRYPKLVAQKKIKPSNDIQKKEKNLSYTL